ncbi:MFS general substrate transporter [Tothia fuscella]|uniref:MFS general substrate transporter n=1 Tax=Tothia fuscella TaxID=1048955 RepID=A0A9P4TY17_9PEZI|nr:MFS general substrate transporter [Tothia fuscella]
MGSSSGGSPSRRLKIDKEDVEERAELEEEDNRSISSTLSTPSSSAENNRGIQLSRTKTTITFPHDDQDLPYNWSKRKKVFVVVVSILTVMNSTVSSGLASNSAPYVGVQFGITNKSLLVLPTSIFLLGYTVGPQIFGPMSEQYGRKTVMLIAFAFYGIFTMAVALSPNFAALVIFRFLEGIAAACPIVVVGGTCADIFKNPESRGRALAIFMGSTTFGPCLGPVISGYVSPTISWRWSFWVGLIFAGVAFVPLCLVPETYAPVLLKHRARKLRKIPGNEHVYAPIELEKQDIGHLITVVLTRPIRMFFFEAIVLFSSLYLSVAYGIFYMFFLAYPVVYVDIYGFSPGEEGLTFLAIGVGACIACVVYISWDVVLRKAHAQNKEWVRKEEMTRLPLACLAGPFFIASCFWLGWSAKEGIHWIVPVLSGVSFGIGYLLIFMALLNYLVDAYKIFAASAMAAASTSRSLFGAILPFAATPMYEKLGVAWACSLLGFLSCFMALIPFVFIWKGTQIRARSKFCQFLIQKEKEDEEARLKKEARHTEREAKVEKQEV